MKKILALMLTIIMIVGIFALPVMAEEDVTVLNENFGKVKVQGKVQTSSNVKTNGTTAYAFRSSFGEDKEYDIVQYVARQQYQDTSGMDTNPSYDFHSKKELVSKTNNRVFGTSLIQCGADERAPIELSGFGWIGATHGTPCGVTVTSANHGVTYSAIGNVYVDPANVKWVLLRVADENTLVFISKDLAKGTKAKPTFYHEMGTTLKNVENEQDVINVDKYTAKQQLRPAYKMTKQNVYVVNNGVAEVVPADNNIYDGDYAYVEEEYTIKNPATVAQAIIDARPAGGYTENPSIAVGEDLITFRVKYVYNSDGTVTHHWNHTIHEAVTMKQWGGIQYGKKGDHLYFPNLKSFTSKSQVEGADAVENVDFDFTNILDTTTIFPTSQPTSDRWADPSYVPNRRLDFDKVSGEFNQVFAGGMIPVYDNVNSERIQNTAEAFYFFKTKKAYFRSVAAKLNTRYPNLTNHTLKGAAYKKYVSDFDGDGTYSYYSVPYFEDGAVERYMYFDLYKPGVTKKYNISSYLGTYSISELEKTANLEYSINYETGILTVSSKENNQTSADSLVLKAKYVGESVIEVETKIRELPELYDVSLNGKLAEVAEMMERVGTDISEYDPALIEKYNSLVAQKKAYEQAADRIAEIEEKMLSLSAEKSTYADVEAVRKEIEDLLEQVPSIDYNKDFSEAARTNIDNVEAVFKAAAETERVENLSKTVFAHVDMNKYGREDIYVTDEDFRTTRQFGYHNSLTKILEGCTAVEKTEGETVYKEYYSKDNHLYAVLDVASDTSFYDGINSSYDKDVYPFLGKTYQFKYVAGTKTYHYKSKGAEQTATSTPGNLYAWYHDNVGPYYEKSELAKNKAIADNKHIVSGDAFLTLLSDAKDYTTKDLITGNEVTAKTGTLKAVNGTEFTVGPFAPAKTAATNGIMLTGEAVTLPLGEEGVKADYINLLANTFTTSSVNTSYMTVEVDYENEDGSRGKKTFALILAKTGYSGNTNTSVQGVVDSSIFKVEKTKAQASYNNVFNNKEATTGISIDDIKFNTKAEGLMIYPSEMIKIGVKYTRDSWYSNQFDNYAGVYKLPVSDLYKVLSVKVKANGASGYANKEASDLYVEGSMVDSSGKAAIPVEVKEGDANYNYYAIYSPTGEKRSLLYAANTEKAPAQPKIDKIEELMQNVSSLEDVAEIEKLVEDLTADGSVKESDFEEDILAAYNEFKEKSDVAVVEDKFEVKQEGENIVIKATVANPTKLEGKPYMVIVPFYKGNEVLATKIYSLESTTEAEITKEITVTEVPEGTSNVKAFIWKDLATLKPLSVY